MYPVSSLVVHYMTMISSVLSSFNFSLLEVIQVYPVDLDVFISQVGIGSVSQDFGGEAAIIL